MEMPREAIVELVCTFLACAAAKALALATICLVCISGFAMTTAVLLCIAKRDGTLPASVLVNALAIATISLVLVICCTMSIQSSQQQPRKEEEWSSPHS